MGYRILVVCLLGVVVGMLTTVSYTQGKNEALLQELLSGQVELMDAVETTLDWVIDDAIPVD